MRKSKDDDTTHNKRIYYWVICLFRLESYNSNRGLFVFCWDRSDPAAHAKHSEGLTNNRIQSEICLKT